MEKERKNFFDLCNMLNEYKRPITLTEIIKRVANEGWYNDFLRLGKNTIIRQINHHNAKYKGGIRLEYDSDDPYDDID